MVAFTPGPPDGSTRPACYDSSTGLVSPGSPGGWGRHALLCDWQHGGPASPRGLVQPLAWSITDNDLFVASPARTPEPAEPNSLLGKAAAQAQTAASAAAGLFGTPTPLVAGSKAEAAAGTEAAAVAGPVEAPATVGCWQQPDMQLFDNALHRVLGVRLEQLQTPGDQVRFGSYGEWHACGVLCVELLHDQPGFLLSCEPA